MLLLLGLMACGTGPFDAPPDSSVTAMAESYTFSWTVDLAFEDGYGYVFKDQVVVTAADQFERDVGVPNVVVDISSHWPGTYLLPESAVKRVTDFDDACTAGEITSADDQQLCDVFDAESADGQSYYEISGEYALAVGGDGEGEFRPNFLRGVTDNRGIVDYYLFFDSTPGAGSEFAIIYDIGVDATSLIVSTELTDGA
jgi:hypothetical protein